MPKVLHIKLHGDVENVQAEGASEWGIVNLRTVQDAIDSMPDAEEIVVHIHSRGGDVDEGFAIHDALRATGKPITTITEGLCASIATVIFLAGSKRKMTSNSTFFIHCPWTFGMGNADEIQKTADQLQAMEDKMLAFYVNKTGGDRDQISALMKEESSLTADKALELKFVTEIVDTMAAAFKKKVYAKHTPKTTNEMPKASDIAKEVLALLTGNKTKAEVKNLDVKLKENEETLHVQTEGADIAIGDNVTYQGKATPEKTYDLADGRKVITDADSRIVDIVAPAADASAAAGAEGTEDKDAKIATLETTVNELKAAQAKMQKTIDEQTQELADNATAFTEIKEGINAMRAATKSGHKVEGEQTRFAKTGGHLHTDDVDSAVKAYKRRAEDRKLGNKKTALRVERATTSDDDE